MQPFLFVKILELTILHTFLGIHWIYTPIVLIYGMTSLSKPLKCLDEENYHTYKINKKLINSLTNKIHHRFY